MRRDIHEYLIINRKRKPLELTCSIYRELKALNITNAAIRNFYNIPQYQFDFFIKNHAVVAN